MLILIIQMMAIVVLCMTATIQMILAYRLLGIRITPRKVAEMIKQRNEQREKVDKERRMAGVIEDSEEQDERI
jgi:hypothetical protein